MKNQDLIDDIVERLCGALPPTAKDLVAKVASEAREAWGGEKVFISKRPGEGRSERNQAILRDYQRGERLAFLERKYGVSQRHILRILHSNKG